MQQNIQLKPDYQKVLEYLVVQSSLNVNKPLDPASLLRDTTKQGLGLEHSFANGALRFFEDISAIVYKSGINTGIQVILPNAIKYVSPENITEYFKREIEQVNGDNTLKDKIQSTNLIVQKMIATNAEYNLKLQQWQPAYDSLLQKSEPKEVKKLQLEYQEKVRELEKNRDESLEELQSPLDNLS